MYVDEQSAPPQLFRFNRYVSATVSAGLAPGVSLGEGIDAMYEIADKVLDERFATALDGPSKDFKESSSSLLFAFLLALGLSISFLQHSLKASVTRLLFYSQFRLLF